MTDEIILQGGQEYLGGIAPRSSLVYTGVNGRALITGFTTIRNWTAYNSNIFYAPIESPNLQCVSIDGELKAMGRYPKTGYITYTGHGDYSISSGAIGAMPNFEGGEVVYKVFRYIINRNRIITQKDNTFLYALDNAYGNNSYYKPTDGNGFFVQNHINTLTQHGEWCYNKDEKRLYVYFGDANPNAHVVKANGIDRLVILDRVKDITFNNIEFDGSLTAIFSEFSENITFNNCVIRNNGTGIYANNTRNFNFIDSIVENCTSNGAMMEYDVSNVTFRNSTFFRCGVMPGMGKSGDGQYNSLYFYGNGFNVYQCKVLQSGYNGIYFDGNDVLIQNNFVDSFCLTKDDGGGIYAQTPFGVERNNRTVDGNIVINAIGSAEGAGFNSENYGQAVPIYLDRNANHVSVTNNYCAHGFWNGILLNGNSNNHIKGNTIYDFPSLLTISQFATSGNGVTRNSVIQGNALIPKNASQHSTLLSFIFVKDDPINIGEMKDNIYVIAENNDRFIRYNRQHPYGGLEDITLQQWQAYGMDQGAVITPVRSNGNDFYPVYNASPNWQFMPLPTGIIDFWGTPQNNGIWLAPYRGIILKKT